MKLPISIEAVTTKELSHMQDLNCSGNPMKLGVVIYSNDPETVLQAFRLSNFALKKGDDVKAFLLGKGVECDSVDTEKFKVTDQIREFLDNGGRTFSCTSCLKLRSKDATEVCPLSTMADLYKIIAESDKVITF